MLKDCDKIRNTNVFPFKRFKCAIPWLPVRSRWGAARGLPDLSRRPLPLPRLRALRPLRPREGARS